jgi:hypothetical protein
MAGQGLAQPVDGAELIENIERQKLGQTGMKFLVVPVVPRAAAMGGAVTAQSGVSSALFNNPAGMGRMERSFDANFGHMQWIADISYNYASMAVQPGGGNYGVVGLSLVAVDYGDFYETVRFDNEDGYLDMGTFSPSAMAVGLGYSRVLTDRFSVGAQAKYVSQDLGASILALESSVTKVRGGGPDIREEFGESTVAVDFGVIYRTGFESLNFAMSVRNFSREVTYYEENFELPLTFRIGMSMNMVDFTDLNQDIHSILLSVDAERPRDYPERIRIGAEYEFFNTLSIRGGYVAPADENSFSLGGGLQTTVSGFEFGADYAYTPYGLFGNVNRLALNIGL